LTRFGGGRRDGCDLSFDNGRWKGGNRDVLSGDVASRISSKDSFDEGVLSGGGKEILLFVFTVLGLVGGDVSKDVKAEDWGGRDGGTGNDVGGAVGDIEGKVFDVVEGGPDRSGRWGILKLGGLRDDRLKDAGGDVKRAWVVPGVVRTLEDLKDGGSGVRNVLLIDVIKGGPGGDGDVGEGGGGNDGGLRGGERHLRQLAPL